MAWSLIGTTLILIQPPLVVNRSDGAAEDNWERASDGIARRVRSVEGVSRSGQINRRGAIQSRGRSNRAQRDRHTQTEAPRAGHPQEEDERVHHTPRVHRDARPRRFFRLHSRR